MKKKDSFYDNRVVNKPWGYEYVVYRNLNNLSVTLLKINHNKKTSSLSPSKKSGFILISGKALFQLGLWKKGLKYIHHQQKNDCERIISFYKICIKKWTYGS